MSALQAAAPPEEARVTGRYLEAVARVRSSSASVVPVEVLAALGYTRIRWRAGTGETFSALDEHGIPAVIVIDVSPLRRGFPVPRMSPARKAWMERICLTYLQDNTRARRVRADYLALPESYETMRELPLTLRRGVAWAFETDRLRPRAKAEAQVPAAALAASGA